MKRILFILSLLFITSISFPLFGQEDMDDDEQGGGEKIRDKMSEFIQRRLSLTKDEADKFTPVFIRYYKEWRQTARENRGDRLILQQKIIELRLRYRPLFRDIIGENRGNQVFGHQDAFIREVIKLRNQQRRNNPNLRPLKQQRRAGAVVLNS